MHGKFNLLMLAIGLLWAGSTSGQSLFEGKTDDQTLFDTTTQSMAMPSVAVNPLPKLHPTPSASRLPSYQTQLEPLASLPGSYQLKLTFNENVNEILLCPEHAAGKMIRVHIDYLDSDSSPSSSPIATKHQRSMGAHKQHALSVARSSNKAPIDSKPNSQLANNQLMPLSELSEQGTQLSQSRFKKNPFFTRDNEFQPVQPIPNQNESTLVQSKNSPPLPLEVQIDLVNPVYLTTTEPGQSSDTSQIKQQLWEMPAASEVRESTAEFSANPVRNPVRIRFADE